MSRRGMEKGSFRRRQAQGDSVPDSGPRWEVFVCQACTGQSACGLLSGREVTINTCILEENFRCCSTKGTTLPSCKLAS